MSVPEPALPPEPADLPAVDLAVFRRTVGHFATGVTVATTRVGTFDHAMTASAFTSVSLEPVLVLVCVDREARFRDAVIESGSWAVSILSVGGRRAADWFALKGRPLVGQLDRYPHHRGITGAALLDGSLAWLECRTQRRPRRRRPRHRPRRGARRGRGRPGRRPAGLPPQPLRRPRAEAARRGVCSLCGLPGSVGLLPPRSGSGCTPSPARASRTAPRCSA